jgi:hypothetical protein
MITQKINTASLYSTKNPPRSGTVTASTRDARMISRGIVHDAVALIGNPKRTVDSVAKPMIDYIFGSISISISGRYGFCLE